MTMISNTGYASRIATISNTVAKSFRDIGFTDAEIKEADSAHISHITLSDSASTLYYWYVLENGEPKIPLSKTTGAGGVPAGHPIFPGGERVIRGVRNIRNFRVIASEADVVVAVTLSTFGRAT